MIEVCVNRGKIKKRQVVEPAFCVNINICSVKQRWNRQGKAINVGFDIGNGYNKIKLTKDSI